MIDYEPWLRYLVLAVVAVDTLVLFLVLIVINNWMNRYEKFRRECGTVFGDHKVLIDNHEQRLQRLGSASPRGVLPREAEFETTWDRRS